MKLGEFKMASEFYARIEYCVQFLCVVFFFQSPYKLFVFLDGESEGKKARNLLNFETCRVSIWFLRLRKRKIFFLIEYKTSD
jgi:hypothetical protein